LPGVLGRAIIGVALPNAGIAQLVERNLAKVEVASSRLVSRSSFLGESVCSPIAFVDALPFPITSQAVGALPTTRRGGRVVMQRPAKPSTPVRFRPPPPKFAFRVRLLALCLASISSFSRQRPAWSSTRLLIKRKSLECPSRLGQCQLAHLPSPRLPRRTTVSGKKKPTSQTARKGTLATGRVRFTGTELLAVQLLPSWPKVLSPQQYAAPAFGLVKLLMITVHVWRPPALTVAKFKPPTIAVGVALPALPVVEPVIETDGSGRSSDVRFANGQINSLAPEAAS
jgi:hypothetical protein